jgi:signal transduction histidine kinase
VLAKDHGRAATMLGELGAEVDEAIDTLSSLALGIYPPVLEEHGIAAALESQVRVGSIPVVVDADGVDRQPIETEAAVYFCCLEAIQNASKHAGAGATVTVRVRAHAGRLSFEIRDDGVGFDVDNVIRGDGLTNLHDRIAAVAGEVHVVSGSGAGTTISGDVPTRI